MPRSALRLATMVAFAAAAVPFATAQEVAWAYVDPMSSAATTFTVPSNLQFCTGGGSITVTRQTQAHRFRVNIPGVSGNTGVVHATAVGGSHTAVVESWGIGSSGIFANIALYSSSGTAANNARFSVLYRIVDDNTRRESQLWANQPTSASYTPSLIYAWNGARGNPTIQRLSTGLYEVHLPGLAPLGAEWGNVFVSPYGPVALRAKIDGWSHSTTETIVGVRTTDSAGAPADGMFTLTYAERAGLLDRADGSGAHVWLSSVSSPFQYPSPAYADSNSLEGPHGLENVTRLGTGRYRVHLPDNSVASHAITMVSGYGASANYASIESTQSDGCGGTFVFVDTYTPNGVPVDASFTLNNLTDQPAREQEVAWAYVPPAAYSTATFTPPLAYQYTPSGQAITVDRDPAAANRFLVKVPQISTDKGNLQVSAYNGNHTAVVNYWYRSGTTLYAWVELFTATGADANNAAFTFAYRADGNNHNREAYVFANLQNATSYTPDTNFSWNANRADPTIVRTGTGTYIVTLPGLAPATTSSEWGHVQVTPVGATGLRANVVAWSPVGSDEVATVEIRNTSGTLVNGQFLLAYNQEAAPIGRVDGSGAHVWASQATATAPYAPSAAFTDSNGTLGPANAEQVTHAALGLYYVDLPDLAPSASSIALVTAYGSNSNYASIAGWASLIGGGTRVSVRTYAATGASADTNFTLLYLTDRPATGSEAASNASYGSSCHGVTLAAASRPISCLPWDLTISNIPTGALFGFVALDLAQANVALGALAPGCSLYTNGAVVDAFLLPAPNPAYRLAIPPSTTFIGLSVYAQGGAWVTGINPLNLVLSNGIRGTVGDV